MKRKRERIAQWPWILVILIFLLSNCEKEKITAREYPRLKTLEVSHIDQSGALFQGEIFYGEDKDIITYGFVWSTKQNPDLDNADKIISNDLIDKAFTARIERALVSNQTYYVRAFLQTSDYLVYGDEVSFLSLGSLSPRITGFDPAIATWGDTLRVRGENFSFQAENNKGYLGEVLLKTVYASDSLLRFEIPAQTNEEVVDLAVEISGNRTVAEEKFSYIKPEITGLDRMEADYGDTLRIHVQNYHPDYLEVKFGDLSARVLAMLDGGLDVVIPTSLQEEEPVIVVESAGFSDQISGFSLNLPVLNTTGSFTSYYNDTLVFEGDHLNPDIAHNQVLFGSHIAEVVFASKTLLKCVVPEELYEPQVDITLQSGTTTLNVGGFDLKYPEFHSILPETITHPDDLIEITGRGFNLNYGYFELFLRHPSGLHWVQQDEIISMTPDKIVISINQGQAFSHLQMSVIGEFTMILETHDIHEIDISTAVNYQSTWTRMNDFPGVGRINAVAFTANGQGYYGTGNEEWGSQIFNDMWRYDAATDTWTQVEDLPGEFRKGAVAMTVDGEAYVGLGANNFTSIDNAVYYNDFYKYDPSAPGGWERMADFAGIGRFKAASFALNGRAYVSTGEWGHNDPEGMFAQTNDTWEYDPILDQWNPAGAFPERTCYAVGFNTADKAFMHFDDTLYEFLDNAWHPVVTENLEGIDMIGFSIGDLIYFGLSNRGDNILVEHDYQNSVWQTHRLIGADKTEAKVFVVDDKAYIIGGDRSYNEVWRFDPSLPEE